MQNLLICVFLQVPSLYSVKKVTCVTRRTSFSVKLTLFFEAPMSVLEQAAVPQFTYVCAIFSVIFICSLILSVLHQTFFFLQEFFFYYFIFLHSFNFRSNNILFMWLILYFLILFISYCSVQYNSSSIQIYFSKKGT